VTWPCGTELLGTEAKSCLPSVLTPLLLPLLIALFCTFDLPRARSASSGPSCPLWASQRTTRRHSSPMASLTLPVSTPWPGTTLTVPFYPSLAHKDPPPPPPPPLFFLVFLFPPLVFRLSSPRAFPPSSLLPPPFFSFLLPPPSYSFLLVVLTPSDGHHERAAPQEDLAPPLPRAALPRPRPARQQARPTQ
jgi:hypothetical protein